MTLFASKWDGQRPLRLICVFPPGSLFDTRRPWALREPAFDPWSFDLGLGGSSLQALLGSIGVGHDSCVTPSSVFATRGAEVTTLS